MIDSIPLPHMPQKTHHQKKSFKAYADYESSPLCEPALFTCTNVMALIAVAEIIRKIKSAEQPGTN